MASGDLRRPNKRDRAAIDAAVARAEAHTGLQFCVYLGRVEGSERDFAASMLLDRGVDILVLVAPKQRSVEVVVAPEARERVSDDHARAAVDLMVSDFASGRLASGLITGLRELAARAGPGTPPPGAVDLPDVVSDPS